MLDSISIILVETSHPGNIGAAARAMKTMGLSKLILVSPKEFPSTHAYARAAGATDILDSVVVVKTLSEAIASLTWVVGTSARGRTFSLPLITPRELAFIAREKTSADLSSNVDASSSSVDAPHTSIGVVFGRESSGLTNEELSLCAAHVHIPANPDYSALNIAAAIQIICYEFYLQSLGMQTPTIAPSPLKPSKKSQDPNNRDATMQEMEGLYGHLEQTYTALGILDVNHPRLLMKRLRRLFSKAQMDTQEVNIIRGMLSAVLKRLG